jgi:hypothetical protein
MSLMSSDDEGEAIGLEKLVDGRHAKANTVASTEGGTKATLVQIHLLLFIGRVTPDAVRCDLRPEGRKESRVCV